MQNKIFRFARRNVKAGRNASANDGGEEDEGIAGLARVLCGTHRCRAGYHFAPPIQRGKMDMTRERRPTA
jgi:hypothetical protein